MAKESRSGSSSANRHTASEAKVPATAAPGRKRPVPIMLALQGGGSHSAFTWGVLDFLLERVEAGDIEITGISGTSGGAVNGCLVAYGLQRDAREARSILHEFWLKNSMAAALSLNPFSIPIPMFWNWNIDWYPWVLCLRTLELVSSPYQKLPATNLFAQVLSSCINFDRLNELHGPKIYVLATNARTSWVKTFGKGELSVDAVLASACIPTVFPAVVLGGDPYWDGGYLKDPGLFPLVNRKHCAGDDILIIGVNSFTRKPPYLPMMAWEISDRLNELTFNSSMVAEVEKVLLVNKELKRKLGNPGTDPRKPFLMHYLEPPGEMGDLGVMSKSNGSYPFLLHLFGMGRKSAEDWWPKCAGNLGIDSTDIEKLIDRKQVDLHAGLIPGVSWTLQYLTERLFGPLARCFTVFPPATETVAPGVV